MSHVGNRSAVSKQRIRISKPFATPKFYVLKYSLIHGEEKHNQFVFENELELRINGNKDIENLIQTTQAPDMINFLNRANQLTLKEYIDSMRTFTENYFDCDAAFAGPQWLNCIYGQAVGEISECLTPAPVSSMSAYSYPHPPFSFHTMTPSPFPYHEALTATPVAAFPPSSMPFGSIAIPISHAVSHSTIQQQQQPSAMTSTETDVVATSESGMTKTTSSVAVGSSTKSKSSPVTPSFTSAVANPTSVPEIAPTGALSSATSASVPSSPSSSAFVSISTLNSSTTTTTLADVKSLTVSTVAPTVEPKKHTPLSPFLSTTLASSLPVASTGETKEQEKEKETKEKQDEKQEQEEEEEEEKKETSVSTSTSTSASVNTSSTISSTSGTISASSTTHGSLSTMTSSSAISSSSGTSTSSKTTTTTMATNSLKASVANEGKTIKSDSPLAKHAPTLASVVSSTMSSSSLKTTQETTIVTGAKSPTKASSATKAPAPKKCVGGCGTLVNGTKDFCSYNCKGPEMEKYFLKMCWFSKDKCKNTQCELNHDRKLVRCTHCLVTGHCKQECAAENIQCKNCGELGHFQHPAVSEYDARPLCDHWRNATVWHKEKSTINPSYSYWVKHGKNPY